MAAHEAWQALRKVVRYAECARRAQSPPSWPIQRKYVGWRYGADLLSAANLASDCSECSSFTKSALYVHDFSEPATCRSPSLLIAMDAGHCQPLVAKDRRCTATASAWFQLIAVIARPNPKFVPLMMALHSRSSSSCSSTICTKVCSVFNSSFSLAPSSLEAKSCSIISCSKLMCCRGEPRSPPSQLIVFPKAELFSQTRQACQSGNFSILQ
mmetsp:Transcript_27347/g.51634  ORF Transcript_27347/g.51634 Transcript_27347/m.51634 type:complete len:212 (-) Transcript_27347:149-784(-)